MTYKTNYKIIAILIILILIGSLFFIITRNTNDNLDQENIPTLSTFPPEFRPLINSRYEENTKYIVLLPTGFDVNPRFDSLNQKILNDTGRQAYTRGSSSYVVFNTNTGTYEILNKDIRDVCEFNKQNSLLVYVKNSGVVRSEVGFINEAFLDQYPSQEYTNKFIHCYADKDLFVVEDHYDYRRVKLSYFTVKDENISEKYTWDLQDLETMLLEIESLDDVTYMGNPVTLDMLEGGILQFMDFHLLSKDYAIFHTSLFTEKIWLYHFETNAYTLLKDSGNKITGSYTTYLMCDDSDSVCYFLQYGTESKTTELLIITKDGVQESIKIDDFTGDDLLEAKSFYGHSKKLMFLEDGLLKIHLSDSVKTLHELR